MKVVLVGPHRSLQVCGARHVGAMGTPSARNSARLLADGVIAGLAGWVCSEVPSSFHASSTGRSWRTTDESAGNLLLPVDAPTHRLRAVGTALRVTVAVTWGVVMSRWLDRRHPVGHGAGVGLALFVVEYLVLGRRRPLVRALPALPQLADQVVFGTVAGAVLGRRRAVRSRPYRVLHERAQHGTPNDGRVLPP
jgi:hypothetical protein